MIRIRVEEVKRIGGKISLTPKEAAVVYGGLIIGGAGIGYIVGKGGGLIVGGLLGVIAGMLPIWPRS